MSKRKTRGVSEAANLDDSVFDHPKYAWLLPLFCFGTMDVMIEDMVIGITQHVFIEGITHLEMQSFSLHDWPNKNLELIKMHMKERGLGRCEFFNRFGVELGSMETKNYRRYDREFGFEFKHVEYVVLYDPNFVNRSMLILERSA